MPTKPNHSHSQWLNFSHNNNHHYQSSEMGWPVLCNYSVIGQIKRRVHYTYKGGHGFFCDGWHGACGCILTWMLKGLPSKVPICKNWLDCHSYFNIGCGCGATNRHMLNPCSIEWWINASAHRTEPKDLLCSPVRIERDWSLVSITLIAVGAQKNVHCTSAKFWWCSFRRKKVTLRTIL